LSTWITCSEDLTSEGDDFEDANKSGNDDCSYDEPRACCPDGDNSCAPLCFVKRFKP
jgi:hypothetical protein